MFADVNVLYVAQHLAGTAAKFGLDEDVVRGKLAEAREKLYRVREKRSKPHLDGKVRQGNLVRATTA